MNPIDEPVLLAETQQMLLMYALCLLVALGLVAIWRWGALEVESPWARNETGSLSGLEIVRRYFWYATVGLSAGLVAGVVMFGAGGRLMMRLLAMTAGDAAQGRITEAEEVVGRITTGGTLAFIGFFGIFLGSFVGIVYMLVRHWLPRGRAGGLTFGIVFLLVVATRADPLRPNNEDFDLVGPAWVAIVGFTAILVGQGMLMAAIAGRYSRLLPLIDRKPTTIAKYLPVYLIWGPAALILAVPLILGGAFALLVAKTEGVHAIFRSPRTLTIGRIIGVALALAAAPGFFIGIADIASSSG